VHEIYDPATDAWTIGPSMPLPRHGVPAVALGDRILVPGGGIVQGLEPTSHVDAFVAEPDDRPCAADDLVACLQGGRFEVSVAWRDPAGGALRRARARVDLDPTAVFSFFDDANFELLVKLLDGRAINGAFWVFYGALTDVEYTISVRDTFGGAARSYLVPAGRLASGADVDAFPSEIEGSSFSFESSLAGAVAAPRRRLGTGACVEDEATLCLQDARIAVRVDWRAPEGAAGHATAVDAARTDQSGLFTFFEPGNVEIAVKVLDGRAVNGHFWMYYGALSDLEYSVEVRDTFTGVVREYRNEAGRLAGVADVEALPDP
jgi:hypothetical protein